MFQNSIYGNRILRSILWVLARRTGRRDFYSSFAGLACAPEVKYTGTRLAQKNFTLKIERWGGSESRCPLWEARAMRGQSAAAALRILFLCSPFVFLRVFGKCTHQDLTSVARAICICADLSDLPLLFVPLHLCIVKGVSSGGSLHSLRSAVVYFVKNRQMKSSTSC